MRPRRVGVTGHRRLQQVERLTAAVDDVLDTIAAGDDGAGLVVVSPLAEGADRLVAGRALARDGCQLEVLLPLPPEDFEGDFDTEESRAEFRELLGRAARVSVLGEQPTREDAYLAGGLALVDDVDVLVALWDGEPSRGRGGTAEIVQYARDTGTPVEWIRT